MHVVDMGQVVSLTLPTHALFLSMYLMGGRVPPTGNTFTPPDLGGQYVARHRQIWTAPWWQSE